MIDVILGLVIVAFLATLYAIWHILASVKEIQHFNEWISHKVHVTNERIAALESIVAKANRNITILDGRVPGKVNTEEVSKKTIKVPRKPRKVKS